MGYRGMKLDENGQMTKRVFNSFGSSSSHTFSKGNSNIEKVPQSSVKSNLTSKMDKPKQPAQNISKDEPVTKTVVGSKCASGNSVGKDPKKSASYVDDANANKKLGSFGNSVGKGSKESDIPAEPVTKTVVNSKGASGNSVGKGPKKYSASDVDDVIARANAKLSTFDFDN